MKNNTDQETLELEAATAVSMMRDSADLDERIGVLKERVGVASDRLAAFIVVIPEGYSAKEAAAFREYVKSDLETATKDAEAQIKFERTWAGE